MNLPELRNLDLSIARARIALSLIAMLSLYVDPSTAGGLFHLSGHALTVLLCHLAYSVSMYVALLRRPNPGERLLMASTRIGPVLRDRGRVANRGADQSGLRIFRVRDYRQWAFDPASPHRTIEGVTCCSVALYLLVILLSERISSDAYVMRAAYLAIAGYLIGFVGQQRADFEERVRELETRAEGHSIARSLHDGYVQALAGVNIRSARPAAS